jgi:hypothetical protein
MFILIPFLKRNNKYFKIYVLFSLIIFYSIVYDFLPDSHFKSVFEKKKYHNIFTDNKYFDVKRYIYRFYTSVIVQSTVGFGDVVPISTLSQLIMSTQALSTLITALI